MGWLLMRRADMPVCTSEQGRGGAGRWVVENL